jgi:hypothetical protein
MDVWGRGVEGREEKGWRRGNGGGGCRGKQCHAVFCLSNWSVGPVGRLVRGSELADVEKARVCMKKRRTWPVREITLFHKIQLEKTAVRQAHAARTERPSETTLVLKREIPVTVHAKSKNRF